MKPPFKNDNLSKIFEKFGIPAFLRSCVFFEFEDFLKEIKAGGDHCLEIGSYHGISAVVLSKYFKQVTAVSIDDPQVRLLQYDIMDHLGIKNITFHNVKTNEQKYHIIKDTKFDFCYMDGDHTNDTRDDWKAARHCGKVLFHEYWPIQPPVWDLVNSLPEEEVTRAKYDCLAYWEKHG